MIKLCLHAVECHCCQTQFVKALYVIAFTQSCLHNSSLSFEMSFSTKTIYFRPTNIKLTKPITEASKSDYVAIKITS